MKPAKRHKFGGRETKGRKINPVKISPARWNELVNRLTLDYIHEGYTPAQALQAAEAVVKVRYRL
jgi:hypothetical protein